MKKIISRIFIKESIILEYIFISALLLFFFSDAANKILTFKGAEFNRVSIIVRACYEVLFIGIIVLFQNRSRLQFLFLFFVWFGVFLISQLIMSFQANYPYNFLENINIFNKYLFVLVVYYALYRYQYFVLPFKRLVKIMELLFIGNSILIIAGFLFKIIVFSTYIKNQGYTFKFGYSGLIPAQNEATMFLFIVISYFYHKQFILKSKSWKFYCVLISALLLGTKGIYIFLVLLFVFHFFKNSTANQRKIALYISIFVVGLILLFIQTDVAQLYLGFYLRSFREFGLIHTLLSGRNIFFEIKLMEIISHWTPLNYLIGGQDQSKYLMEMDLFDAFLFFGLIGMFILIVLYFKTIFRFNVRQPFHLFFVSCFFFISFFAGHFFASAVNALYLSLVCLYFYVTEKDPDFFINEKAIKTPALPEL